MNIVIDIPPFFASEAQKDRLVDTVKAAMKGDPDNKPIYERMLKEIERRYKEPVF